MRTDCIIYLDYWVFGTPILAQVIEAHGLCFPDQVLPKCWVSTYASHHFIPPGKAFQLLTIISSDYMLIKEKKLTPKM